MSHGAACSNAMLSDELVLSLPSRATPLCTSTKRVHEPLLAGSCATVSPSRAASAQSEWGFDAQFRCAPDFEHCFLLRSGNTSSLDVHGHQMSRRGLRRHGAEDIVMSSPLRSRGVDRMLPMAGAKQAVQRVIAARRSQRSPHMCALLACLARLHAACNVLAAAPPPPTDPRRLQAGAPTLARVRLVACSLWPAARCLRHVCIAVEPMWA